MKWVTRENAAVDRIACPWLIRRFIDEEAEFLYVPPDQVERVVREQGAIPFDVEGAHLGHREGRCSFESILVEYGLGSDPALAKIGQIIHAADVATDVDLAPEAAGLKAIAHGFRFLHGREDHRKLELETPMYDALYEWAGRAAGEKE
jgi:hypothetical protein